GRAPRIVVVVVVGLNRKGAGARRAVGQRPGRECAVTTRGPLTVPKKRSVSSGRREAQTLDEKAEPPSDRALSRPPKPSAANIPRNRSPSNKLYTSLHFCRRPLNAVP